MNGCAEALVRSEAVNIAPMLPGSFDIDNRGGRHPVGLLRIVELHDGVVNFAAKLVKAQVVETGFERSDEFDDGAALALDPDIASKRERVIAAA